MIRLCRPKICEIRQPLPNLSNSTGILAGFPFVSYMAVAECLGPSHPQTVLVAGESLFSSGVNNLINGYYNKDLD